MRVYFWTRSIDIAYHFRSKTLIWKKCLINLVEVEHQNFIIEKTARMNIEMSLGISNNRQFYDCSTMSPTNGEILGKKNTLKRSRESPDRKSFATFTAQEKPSPKSVIVQTQSDSQWLCVVAVILLCVGHFLNECAF